MTYQVSWLVEKQLIHVNVTGEFTVSDLAHFDAQVVEHLQASPADALTHVLVDLRAVTKFPTNIGEIHQHANARKEPNMGWVLVISENRMIRFVANLITQLSKTRFRNFETTSEAIDFLRIQDKSIDWSSMTVNMDNDLLD